MASFVLVHGSGQSAESWSRVRALLEKRGHVVATPDLPKDAADWRLEDHAARIAESVTAPDSVVVAHSLCGAFLPLVPALRECGLLVFLAAVIPEPGKSIREQFTGDPSMFSPGWIEAGARWFDASEMESLAREFLFHDCDEETISWALGTMQLLDTRHLVTQLAPFPCWPGVPTASIIATRDRTLTPAWGRRMTRDVLGREAIEIQAGHCPHISRPQQLAVVLEKLVARPSRGSDER